MTLDIDIQNATETKLPFPDSQIAQWAESALSSYKRDAELTIRFVLPDEMIELNHAYRKQNKVTNVLAFPYKLPKIVAENVSLLGDIIICPEVLENESKTQNKSLDAHWALIIIHGILHLLGYDHIEDKDAELMQSIEINVLKQLGYPNPYELEDDNRA